MSAKIAQEQASDSGSKSKVSPRVMLQWNIRGVIYQLQETRRAKGIFTRNQPNAVESILHVLASAIGVVRTVMDRLERD
ncbi:hypothetical protein Tco_0676970 [Tanacetum coccineum]